MEKKPPSAVNPYRILPALALRALARGLAAARRTWAIARVRRELHALSDRTLNDIGLSRDQIDALFR